MTGTARRRPSTALPFGPTGRPDGALPVPGPAAPPSPPRTAPPLLPTARTAAPHPVPTGADFDRPNPARVQDFLLGGAAHGAVDRAFAASLLRAEPRLRAFARTHRSFLRRAVRFLLAAGIDQFVELGSGIPTMGAVHEVIAHQRSRATVAYVDLDPVAVDHARHLLAGVPATAVVGADVRDVDAVLDAPALGEVVDLTRPVGLLALSVLAHVEDADDPAGLVGRYLARVPTASALVLSHLTADGNLGAMRSVERLLGAYLRARPRTRTAAEVATMLRGVDLVEPGLSRDCWWRPTPGRAPRPAESAHWVGVGFRP